MTFSHISSNACFACSDCFSDVKELQIEDAACAERWFSTRRKKESRAGFLYRLPTQDRTIVLEERVLSTRQWNISFCTQLEVLTIGDLNGEHVMNFELIDLPLLKSLKIGKRCFTGHPYSFGHDEKRSFVINNCPQLETFEIGCYSFSDCLKFSIACLV